MRSVAMRREPALASAPGEWWAADLELPALLFRVDYVVMDKTSGAYDNNK
jgi:hypothetical protein